MYSFCGAVTGVFCFLQLASPELQQALHIQLLSEQTAMKRLKDLNYLKRQIRNPLYGIMFSRKLLEGTELGAEQKQFLQTGIRCQRQISKILDDSDLDSIIDGYDICECVASSFYFYLPFVWYFEHLSTRVPIKSYNFVFHNHT